MIAHKRKYWIIVFVCIIFLLTVVLFALGPKIKAWFLIESMEHQEGGEFVRQGKQLIKIGQPAVSLLLTKGLNSHKDTVRGACVEILGGIGNPIVIPYLKEIADSETEIYYIRRMAVLEIYEITGKLPEGWRHSSEGPSKGYPELISK